MKKRPINDETLTVFTKLDNKLLKTTLIYLKVHKNYKI